MRKIFVLYSLKQKLSPSIYKTKSIVNKHMNNNKSLQYQQFDNQQHAKLFVQKFSLQIKNKTIFQLSQEDINGILESVVGKKRGDDEGIVNDNGNGVSVANNNSAKVGDVSKVKKKSSPATSTSEQMTINKSKKKKPQTKKQMAKQINKQPQWTVLPNGYAFKNNKNTAQNMDNNNNNINNANTVIDRQQQIQRKQQQEQHYNQQLKQRYQQLRELRSIAKSNLKSYKNINKNKQLNNNNNRFDFLDNTTTIASGQAAIKQIEQVIETKTKQLFELRSLQQKRRRHRRQQQQQQSMEQLQSQLVVGQKQLGVNINIISNKQINNNNNNTVEEQKIQIVLNYDDIHEVDYRTSNSSTQHQNIQPKQQQQLKNQQYQPKQQSLLMKQQIQFNQLNKKEQLQKIDDQERIIRKRGRQQFADEKIHWGGELIKQSQTIMSQIQMQQLEGEVEREGDKLKQKQKQQQQQGDKEQQNSVKHQKEQQQQQTAQMTTQKGEQQKQHKDDLLLSKGQQQLKLQRVEQYNQVSKQQQTIQINKVEIEYPFQQQLQQQQQQLQQQQMLKFNKKQLQQQQQHILQHQFNQQPSSQQQQKLVQTPSLTKISNIIIKPHPYNKQHLKNVISERLALNQFGSQQNLYNLQAQTIKYRSQQQQQQIQERQQQQQKQQQIQQQFVIYPSLVIKQSPGFAIGSYVIKSTKNNTVLKQQSIKLGQYKREQANLLTLAFTLSSMGQYVNGYDNDINNNNIKNYNNNNINHMNNNKRIRLHLPKQMHQSIIQNYKLDKKLKQTQQFTQSIEQRFKNRIEYIY